MIRLYNTLTRQKETLKPLVEGEIKMYVCGPTVYNYIHIGNARSAVAFDTIRRYLTFRGYKVTYISNFTDVDDKVIRVAKETGLSVKEVADKYIAAFFEDAGALNVQAATVHPRVMDHMDEIISFISDLIDKGYAYESEGDVYYRTSHFKDYGKLSDQSLSELKAGASERTASEDDRKKEQLVDFALWKSAKAGEISWTSPWGEGRPGWHIECSVMAGHYLGKTIDIHAGGHDLTFPHHENEIAQSEAHNGQEFAHYWLHNGFVTAADGEKMSKSLGNFTLVHDLIKVVDPKVVRLYLSSAHYRHPLVFSEEKLKEAASNLERFKTCMANIDYRLGQETAEGKSLTVEEEEEINSYYSKFIEAMDDDFNTPNGLGIIFELSKSLNLETAKEEASVAKLKAGRELLVRLLEVFGVEVKEDAKELLDEDIQTLIDRRNEARAGRDFREADRIRDELKAKGIILEDTNHGTRWRRENND